MHARDLPFSGISVPDNSSCIAAGQLSMTFLTTAHGWIASAGCGAQAPGLWQTTDGGSSWQPADLAAPPGGWPPGATLEAQAPVVTSAGAVIAGVTTGAGELVVEQLGRGGSWRYLGALSTGELDRPAALDVIDAAHFVEPASDGMWVTADAGRTWRFVASGLDLAELGTLSLGRDRQGSLEGMVLARSLAENSTDCGPDGELAACGPESSGPVVLRSVAGGISWQPAGATLAEIGHPVSAYDLVDFASASSGYLAGPAGLIATDDGGASWEDELGANDPVEQLQLGGPGDVVALTPDELLVSNDSGHHWRLAAEPAQGALDAVAFADSNVGYGLVCGDDGFPLAPVHTLTGPVELVRTVDGGRSWRPVSLPPGVGCADETASLPVSDGGATAGVCVASARVLYALAESDAGIPPEDVTADDAGGHPALYESTDGARSWRQVASSSDAGLLACGHGRLWTYAAGEVRDDTLPDVVLRSDDGGRRFRPAITSSSTAAFPGTGGPFPHLAHFSGSPSALINLSARDDVLLESCWPCDNQLTTVQTSTDGGHTWSQPGAPAPGVIDATGSFVSTRTGFVLGFPERDPYAGSVLDTTSDGGRMWRRLASFGTIP